mmetsp:Transcript_124536/g.398369  ORF Transcript_124536/g.398369 Transcript_124536/m.398369 type:complete len:90 (-) Transcript_124536:44-313(-)
MPHNLFLHSCLVLKAEAVVWHRWCHRRRRSISTFPRAALTHVAAVLPAAALAKIYVDEGEPSESMDHWMNARCRSRQDFPKSEREEVSD